jgi:hypothetical protein
MPGRLPPTLLHGRLRTSTLLLVLAFLAVLALYLLVRPVPAGTVAGQGGSGSPAATRSGPATSVPETRAPTSTATSTAASTTRAASTTLRPPSTAPTLTTSRTTETSASSPSTTTPP